MKQFIGCLGFSLLLYFISSIIGQNWNAMEWKNGDGRFIFGVFLFLIWLVPIMVNAQNGDDNFKNFY